MNEQTGSNIERCFVVGDIHGCAKTFISLLFDELEITKEDQVICVGDYIDRGPASKEVIDEIINLKKNGYNIVTLRGNHEQLFIDSETSPEDFNMWFNNGGVATLKSFDIRNYYDLDDVYRAFFESTLHYTTFNNFYIVHAGFNFREDDFLEDKHAMLWLRDMWIDTDKLDDNIIIHGHTPTPLKKVNKNLNDVEKTRELNIDTGCVYTYAGYNYLTAVELNTLQLTSIKNIESNY